MRTIGLLFLFLPWRLLSANDNSCERYGHDVHENCTFAVDIVVSLPQWSVLCPGDTLTLTATAFGGTPPYTYMWSNGETTETITMTIPTFGSNFSVTVTDANGCTGEDVAHLKYFEWTANLTIQAGTFCTGQTTTLTASLFPLSNTSVYEWSTGETTSTIIISANGTYSVTITDPAMPCPMVTNSIDVTSFVNALPPEPVISGPTELCPGQIDTLYASGGPFASYVWFPTYASETEILEINWPGEYILFVLNEEGCEGIDTFVVEEGAPQVTLNEPEPICEGQSTIIEVTNASYFESFFWSTGETSTSITVTSFGFYAVTVYSPGGCSSFAEVFVPPTGTLIELNGTTFPVTSCTTPDGAIDLSISPPGNYLYLWSNGETTEDLANLESGIYFITVTDDGGCSAGSSFFVESDITDPLVTGDLTHATCNLANGGINLSISPPDSYAFIWSSGQTTEDLTALMPGSYSVTVTDLSTGCFSVASFVITNSDILLMLSAITTPVISCANPNGSIDLSVMPSGTYSYVWSNGATTEDLLNVGAGNYIVTVSAGGSCVASDTFTIENGNNLPALILFPTSDTCSQSLGSIDLSITPGGTYEYLWSNGSMTEDLYLLPTGQYTITVTDLLTSCTTSAVTTVADYPLNFNILGTTLPNSSCTGANGAIDIQMEPEGSYLFTWSGGQTTEDISGLASGLYTVTVTLGSTCSQSASFDVINESIPFQISGQTVPNESCDQPNGSIDLTINPPDIYSFMWSNGATSEDLSLLTGGTYSVTVTNPEGCIEITSFTIINSGSNFSVSAIAFPNTSCLQGNGSIDLTPVPTGSYQFAWTTGATTEDVFLLTSGTYGVTVTDANSCSLVMAVSVADSVMVPSITSLTTPDICGNQNGSIDVSIQPSIGNNFIWSTGSMNEDIYDLVAGTYFLTVTLDNGCSAMDSISVPFQGPGFASAGIVVPNRNCTMPDGAIDLSILPGGTYSFLWSNTAISEDLANLEAGIFTVLITDTFNCVVSDTFLVTDETNVPAIISSIASSTCGMPNGGIDLTVTPSINSVFAWSNGESTEDVNDLLPGMYTVTITDTITGCSISDTFDVPNINANFSVTGTLMDNTSCTSPNGSIDITVSPPGTYLYIWSNGMTSEDLNNLDAGSYTVTITDQSLCASIESFTIVSNSPGAILSSSIAPSSCGQSNGAIDLTANPPSGNEYAWSGGQMTEDIFNLLPGYYYVTVTASSGCTTIDSFYVGSEGLAISIDAATTPNTSCLSPNGTIELDITPAGLYDFAWTTGQSSGSLDSLSAGQYDVMVSDSTGCTAQATFIIQDQLVFPVILSSILQASCGHNNGSIDLTIEPTDLYSFHWSNGAVTEDVEDIPPGQYIVTVTGEEGCTADTTFEIANTGLTFSLTAEITNNSDCTSGNGSIDLTVSPPGDYLFLWSTGLTTEDITALVGGLYDVVVTDLSGCSTSGHYLIENETVPLDAMASITPATCGEDVGAIDLTVQPATGNTFLWSNGHATEDIRHLPPGLYGVTITNTSGCTWSSSFEVEGSPVFDIQIEAQALQNPVGYITITVTVTLPEEAIDTIIWLPENLFSCPEMFCLEQTIPLQNEITEISVSVIDTNGCQNIASLLLEASITPDVFIPNVFSPNGDGVNDVFTLYGNQDIEIVDILQIFDRWGNQVFIHTKFPPNEEQHGWDGTFRGTSMNPAVFAYWARVRYTDGTLGSFKGDITLVK